MKAFQRLLALLLPLVWSTAALGADGATISTNATVYHPGDTMICQIRLVNSTAASVPARLYIAVELGGVLYFYPSYTPSVSPVLDFVMNAGEDTGVFTFTQIEIPALEQTFPITWYAAVINTETNSLFGSLSSFDATLEPASAATPTETPTTANAPTNTPPPAATATPTQAPSPTPTLAATPNPYPFMDNNITVRFTSTDIIIHTIDIPNHPYGPFPNQYNPNSVLPQNLTFTMPLTPAKATTPGTLNMGPIGVCVNGVPIFNPYNAQGQNAVSGPNAEHFDSCDGHPQQTGMYHYHEEPACLLSIINDPAGQHSSLVALALDGYGVYGPYGEGGVVPTDLDSCNGHFGPTPQHPEGIYHYHMTTAFPYIMGCYTGIVP